MKIALFYNRSPGTIGEYFESALRDLGHSVDYFSIFDAHACKARYDICLRVDHGDYSHDLPAGLRPAAFYVVDTHLAKSWRGIQRQAGRYDLVLCAQRRAAERLPRAHWVPLGCDLRVHQAQPAEPSYDLAFVGNDGGVPRKFYLQELRERYPKSFIGRAPYTRMAEIYARSKIGFHYIECTSPLKDHVSMRVYEILASGTLLMANALEAGAFEAVGLQDGRDLVVFRTPRDLFDKIDYYLSHEAQRRQIAQAGQQLAVASYTYRQRAEQIIRLIQRELSIN